MQRFMTSLLLGAALAVPGCAPELMSASIQLRSAPPPPAFELREAPRFHYLSEWRVSVIDDDSFGYDMFACDGDYFLFSGGYWYRSHDSRGPFVAVQASRVPRRVFEVDDRRYRWRNHPQGWRGGDRHDDKHDRGGGPRGGGGR